MSEGKTLKKIYGKSEREEKEMSIIKDERQYSIRIPKDFADTIKEMAGDLENFKFKFILEIPSIQSQDKPKLTGELIYEK